MPVSVCYVAEQHVCHQYPILTCSCLPGMRSALQPPLTLTLTNFPWGLLFLTDSRKWMYSMANIKLLAMESACFQWQGEWIWRGTSPSSSPSGYTQPTTKPLGRGVVWWLQGWGGSSAEDKSTCMDTLVSVLLCMQHPKFMYLFPPTFVMLFKNYRYSSNNNDCNGA